MVVLKFVPRDEMCACTFLCGAGCVRIYYSAVQIKIFNTHHIYIYDVCLDFNHH